MARSSVGKRRIRSKNEDKRSRSAPVRKARTESSGNEHREGGQKRDILDIDGIAGYA